MLLAVLTRGLHGNTAQLTLDAEGMKEGQEHRERDEVGHDVKHEGAGPVCCHSNSGNDLHSAIDFENNRHAGCIRSSSLKHY